MQAHPGRGRAPVQGHEPRAAVAQSDWQLLDEALEVETKAGPLVGREAARRPEAFCLKRGVHDCVVVVAAGRRAAYARTRLKKARDAFADQAVGKRRVARPRRIEAVAPLEQVGHELLLVVRNVHARHRAQAGELAGVIANELNGARMNAVVAVGLLHWGRRRSGDGLQARTPASRRHVAVEQAEAPRLAAPAEQLAKEQAG